MLGLFRNRERTQRVEAIYAALVAQARRPTFFLDLAVPDTPDGRYGLMVLHVFLLAYRLRHESMVAKEAAQAVCDRFFTEMDQALRDLGVGDMSVPKRIRKVAGFYAGASAAYTQALESGDEDELAAALTRNVYVGTEASEAATEGARHLADYARRQAAELAAATVEDLLAGRLPAAEPMRETRSA